MSKKELLEVARELKEGDLVLGRDDTEYSKEEFDQFEKFYKMEDIIKIMTISIVT